MHLLWISLKDARKPQSRRRLCFASPRQLDHAPAMLCETTLEIMGKEHVWCRALVPGSRHSLRGKKSALAAPVKLCRCRIPVAVALLSDLSKWSRRIRYIKSWLFLCSNTSLASSSSQSVSPSLFPSKFDDNVPSSLHSAQNLVSNQQIHNNEVHPCNHRCRCSSPVSTSFFHR